MALLPRALSSSAVDMALTCLRAELDVERSFAHCWVSREPASSGKSSAWQAEPIRLLLENFSSRDAAGCAGSWKALDFRCPSMGIRVPDWAAQGGTAPHSNGGVFSRVDGGVENSPANSKFGTFHELPVASRGSGVLPSTVDIYKACTQLGTYLPTYILSLHSCDVAHCGAIPRLSLSEAGQFIDMYPHIERKTRDCNPPFSSLIRASTMDSLASAMRK